MQEISLSQKEKKELKGLAQTLKPVAIIGKQGLTECVLKELDRALHKDELIKVRFNAERAEIEKWCLEIETQVKAVFLSKVGKTASFYRMKKDVNAAD